AGKGVIVCDSKKDAIVAVTEMMDDKRFGAAGDQVVVEERLTGPELSLLAICDGNMAKPLIHSRDHKRAYDGDQGPNTGGMGAYAPVPEVGQAVIDQVMAQVVQPAVDGMARKGTPYIGVLYAGVMLTPNGIKTLEFNCRFGDPETQVVLPMLKSDLAAIMLAAIDGKLDEVSVENHGGAAATVVMASGGYPGSYEKGKPISGLDGANNATVFHAGTKVAGNEIVTSGGRVLAVTGMGESLQQALDQAYKAVEVISFENAEHRTDIGHSSL
ncbi:MAG: phosphoribosylamine--glycine ligase, partial [Chloroflexota bacterium]